MRNRFWIGAAGLLCMGCVCACQPELKDARLMSYNVKNGCGLDDSTDYARTAAVIRKENPDVVAVQELDSVTGRSGGAYVLGELAKHTGMYDTYAPAIDFDGGKYGIGILSKEKPLHVYRRALPGREEARTMLVTEFEDYVYICTHLSLTEEDRTASLPIIKEEIARFKKPVFIAGDWNATPESDFLKEMQDEFTVLTDMTQPTFPADTPDSTLDYIAVNKGAGLKMNGKKAYTVDAPVQSDHRPVVVVAEWSE